MSQDGNNLFNQQDFQSSPFDTSQGIYHPDMQMQFAPTVPHRQPATQQQQQQQQQRHFGMNFTTSPFQNQDLMMPPPQFSYNYPGSPYERSEASSSGTTNTGKQTQSKAERRAEHNAIERARRESLNSKFQQLAFALPNLQNDTRPSKSTIIDRTLDFVTGAILKEERMNYRIKELEKFTRYLLSELDKKSGSTTTVEDVRHSPLDIPAMIPSVSPPPSSPPAMEESNHEHVVIHRSIRERKSSPVFKKDTNGMTIRRPVSRSSVAMIPKLEHKTTNWPMSNQQQQQQQQQQQHIIQQQLLLDHQMMKENHSLNFQPQYQQNQAAMFQKFQDHSIAEDNFMMNEQQYDPNFMINNTIAFMEPQHRR